MINEKFIPWLHRRTLLLSNPFSSWGVFLRNEPAMKWVYASHITVSNCIETVKPRYNRPLRIWDLSISTKILQLNKCKIYEQEPLNNDTCLYVQCNLWVSQRLNVCDEHRKLSCGTLGWYLVIHFDNQW